MKRLLQAAFSTGLLSLCFASTAFAQPSIIVENFRNVNCTNCREPDIAFEQWIEQNKSQFHVDMIYYHNEITDPQDPFYLASKPEVDYRNKQFYVVDANPRVFVQGIDAQSTPGTWQQYVSIAAQQAPKATVTVSDMKDLGSNKYEFKVNVVNNSGEPVRVYAAVTESGIIYDNPQGYKNPPSGEWDHIFRKMLPDRDGTDPITSVGEFTFTLDLTNKPWNINNMDVIAFAQAANLTQGTRVIWGHTTAAFNFAGVEPEYAAKGFSIRSLANPVSASAPIEVRMHTNGHLRLEMIDMTGKKIATLADQNLPEGLYEFNERVELVAGAYLVNAFIDGVYAGNVKLVKQ